MKKRERLLMDLTERLELPQETLECAARLTVTAGRRALIENHRGVLEYSGERIAVGTAQGRLILSGTGLRFLAMNRRELLIGGRVQTVEWEQGT